MKTAFSNAFHDWNIIKLQSFWRSRAPPPPPPLKPGSAADLVLFEYIKLSLHCVNNVTIPNSEIDGVNRSLQHDVTFRNDNSISGRLTLNPKTGSDCYEDEVIGC